MRFLYLQLETPKLDADGCCACVQAPLSTTTTCNTMMALCDLPCTSAVNTSCTSYMESSDTKPANTVRLQPGCACPEGYTVEVSSNNVLICTRMVVCTCNYHGHVFRVSITQSYSLLNIVTIIFVTWHTKSLIMHQAIPSEKFPLFIFLSSVRDLSSPRQLHLQLTFTEHIAKLTRSTYFQLIHLGPICISVSPSTFTSIIDACVCSRLNYCNSLLADIPKVRLYPLQFVLNAAARLIVRLPRFSHISIFMTEHIHWLTSLVAYNSMFALKCLVPKAQLGLASKYICDRILRPLWHFPPSGSIL